MTRRQFLWIRILGALLLLAIMAYTVRIEAILHALQSTRWHYVLLGLLLLPVNIGMQALKWGYLARIAKPSVTTIEIVASLLGGYSFGIITPGRIGEYSRALFIKDTPALKMIGLTVIDKLYNLGLTVAVGLPALFTLPWAHDFFHPRVFWSILGLMALFNLILLYFSLDPRPVRSLLYALQLNFPRKDKIAQLVGGLDRFGFIQARRMLLLTTIYYTTVLLQFFVLLQGFTNLNFVQCIRIAAAVLFTKAALPITIGGLGLDQLVSVQFSNQFHVPEAASFNASLLLFVINVLLPALAGIAFIGKLQFKTKNGEAPPS